MGKRKHLNYGDDGEEEKNLHKGCTLIFLPVCLLSVCALSCAVNYFVIYRGILVPWFYHQDDAGAKTIVAVGIAMLCKRPKSLYELVFHSGPSPLLTLLFYPLILPHILHSLFERFKRFSSTDGTYDFPAAPEPGSILHLSATQLGSMVRERMVSSQALTEMCIRRIERVNPYLNAVVGVRFEAAREEAKAVDAMVASGESLPPFAGVPIISKECYETVGMPFTGGVVGRKHVVGESNSPVVQQCMDAGMIVLGVTNTSEACMFHESNNLVHGQTNNPYDLSRSPGGSSGGCAAITATGSVPMAIASDVGGSIRIPAAFCGLFGHKPTGGVVSNARTYPSTGERGVDRFCQLGPITRHAEDLFPFLTTLAKPTVSLSHPAFVDIKRLTVYVVDSPIGSSFLRSGYDPELKEAQARAVKALAGEGCDIQHISLGGLGKLHTAFAYWGACMDSEKPEPFLDTITEGVQGSYFPIWEFVRALVGQSTLHTIPAIGLAVFEMIVNLFPSERVRLVKEFETEKTQLTKLLTQRACVLLLPTLPSTAFRHHEGILRFLDVGSTCLFNVLEFPSTAIPLGISGANGMPLSVQCVAGPYFDHRSIAVAQFLEKKGLAGWRPPGRSEQR